MPKKWPHDLSRIRRAGMTPAEYSIAVDEAIRQRESRSPLQSVALRARDMFRRRDFFLLAWIPVVAILAISLFQKQAAISVARENERAAQQLADERADLLKQIDAWQEHQKQRARIALEGVKSRRERGDYSEVIEYVDALEFLGGWGDDVSQPSDELIAFIKENRLHVLIAVTRELGFSTLADDIESGAVDLKAIDSRPVEDD